MTTRTEVEYLLAGLEDELRDGLARLERADAGHVIDNAQQIAYYRRLFEADVRRLRAELDSPTPDIHEIAVSAMQASWLARIWPVLHASRLQRHAPNLTPHNQAKQAAAAKHQARCADIAGTLRRPTPAAIRRAYQAQYPQDAAPSLRTIARYLTPKR